MSSRRLTRFSLRIRRRLRPLLLVATVAFILVEVVALSPSSVEDTAQEPAHTSVDPEELAHQDDVTLATGIPKNKIAEYSVDQFNYVSTKGTERQWKLTADKAFLYNQDKLVHTRNIRALLFDPSGKTTIVTGKEAKYFMNQKERDIEIFGNVKTVLPDGFELDSEYLRYRPNDRRIDIPEKYAVHGAGQEKDGQHIEFTSLGFDFPMSTGKITLPHQVVFTMVRAIPAAPAAATAPTGPSTEQTRIESDHCVIDRNRQLAHFRMFPNRPEKTRFVHITQEKLFARARRANLNYGDFSKLLNYISAEEDVLIKETGSTASLKYATGGRADFDTKSDVIVLTEFPQVYQDNDTVTGDLIKVHRDSDVVEVEQSNAYTNGN